MSTNLVFIGSGHVAVPTLRALAKIYTVTLVITQPARKAGTGKKRSFVATPVATLADELGLQVSTPVKIIETLEDIERIAPEVIILADYGQIIPNEILEVCPLGILNIHPSLLPKYRGPSPIQSAILQGDEVTGVSIMRLDEKMDHGPILAQKKVALQGIENSPQLTEKLAVIGADLLTESLPAYLSGDLQPKEQAHDKATYCNIISRDDGRIDFNKDAEQTLRQFRALTPWPGVWFETELNGKLTRIKLHAAKKWTDELPSDTTSGKLFEANQKLGLHLNNDTIEIIELQPEGKKRMTAKEFVVGYATQDVGTKHQF